MKASHFFTLIICLFGLLGCDFGKYDRKPNCHLDQMHIKGNVVKIETIVQSTMPLTELYTNAFDPQYAISTYIGNITIEFDKDGNVKHSSGYGLDGKELFVASKYKNDGCYTIPCVLINPTANQQIDNIKTIESENGDIVNVKYYDGNELIWDQKTYYNEDGSAKFITKDYAQLNIKIKDDVLNIAFADTTTYDYLEYDNLGNWTEAEVSYKGVLPRHAHSYKIKRQITYLEDDKKPTLIEELVKYNKVDMTTSDETEEISLGKYGTMRIPLYMALQSNEYVNKVKDSTAQSLGSQVDLLNFLFMSVYDNKDAYATISVCYTPWDGIIGYDDFSSEELDYNEETDRILEEKYREILVQGEHFVLKWLPYEFVTISGHRALKLTYYRYSNDPIPVYCENYTIPMPDGTAVCLIFSFQSNLYNRFHNDFKQSINSIRFRF